MLSSREIELIDLAAKGLSNKEIADKLELSLKTVKNHFTHAYIKLGANSRTTAVVASLKQGYILLD